MKRLALAACVAATFLPGSAMAADWYKAASPHFVVYAKDSSKDLETFTTRLERFHQAMALVTGDTAEPPSPSNRVTIFVVSGEREVRRLHGGDDKYVNGFYVPRAGKSLAIVPRLGSTSGTPDTALITLLHEYAHHFLLSGQSLTMPRWMSEGAAEFFASSTFKRDGSILMGRAAQHRGYELFNAKSVPVEDLLDPELYEAHRGKGYDAFYGRSWLLYHYLTFAPSRKGQMRAYLTRIGQGTGERAAAEEVFGDFETLEDELDDYLDQRRISAINLSPENLPAAAVTITRLREGEAEILPLTIESRRGVDSEAAAEIVTEAREIAARYPNDPAVLSELAEAEYDTGHYDAAIAAADQALAADPRTVNAYLQKGYALFAKARDAEEADAAAYKAARAPFLALNKIENDHPLPLVYYYRSFAEAGVKPPELAVQGLERASELAPFDLSLQMNVATTLIGLGKGKRALRHLQPVAYNPHGGSQARAARALLARLNAEPDWTGQDLGQVLSLAHRSDDVDAAH
ncbi:hypothetical protein [Novosphingobium mangrovi (ex Hu et al. 2023)]|uniref:DUF1570 domain-containing protein n=1 Tax=Novosphingobium mangrovi (ex Hu et al. 2023) TaxID=2930094 RepID=A0ABT0A8D4_9SPHN|nr:hypothetical protein [Novosphingobium mangrovi (ex Hu et al. 2023)]MCJ1959437.1 hypothetical protein [Novosphingobium mangrovi (ex Hu et al. 2023)]